MLSRLRDQCLMIGLCLVSMHALGQEWKVGTRWVYEQMDYFPDGIDEYFVLNAGKDTVINKDTFLIVQEYILSDLKDHIDTAHLKNYLVKKDGDQVLLYNPAQGSLELLYDFGARQGDTLTIWNGDNFYDAHIQIVIESLDTIDFNGVPTGAQYIRTIAGDGAFSWEGRILRGYGHESFFFPVYGAVDPPPGGRFLCFENGMISFPGQSACDLVVRRDELMRPGIEIFPNPCTNEIRWSGEPVWQWSLYSSSGIELKHGEKSAYIPMTGIPPGVYFLYLTEADQRRSRAKIIKL